MNGETIVRVLPSTKKPSGSESRENTSETLCKLCGHHHHGLGLCLTYGCRCYSSKGGSVGPMKPPPKNCPHINYSPCPFCGW